MDSGWSGAGTSGSSGAGNSGSTGSSTGVGGSVVVMDGVADTAVLLLVSVVVVAVVVVVLSSAEGRPSLQAARAKPMTTAEERAADRRMIMVFPSVGSSWALVAEPIGSGVVGKQWVRIRERAV